MWVHLAHFSRVDSLNVHAERSRLMPELLARWRGLRVGWFDASAVSRNRNFLVPRPLLALLDSGVAQARFDFGAGEQTYCLSAGADCRGLSTRSALCGIIVHERPPPSGANAWAIAP